MRLGRIGHRQREFRPGARGIERPLVVPGAKQTEDLAGEGACEQTVYLVETPDEGGVQLAENFAAEIAPEVRIRTAALIPNVGGRNGDVHLVGQGFSDSQQE